PGGAVARLTSLAWLLHRRARGIPRWSTALPPAHARPAARWPAMPRRPPVPCGHLPASHRHTIFEVFESDRANALNVQEVLDAGEATVLGPKVNDRLRGGGPHTRQSLQLLGVGGVDVDLPARGIWAVAAGAAGWLVNTDKDL